MASTPRMSGPSHNLGDGGGQGISMGESLLSVSGLVSLTKSALGMWRGPHGQRDDVVYTAPGMVAGRAPSHHSGTPNTYQQQAWTANDDDNFEGDGEAGSGTPQVDDGIEVDEQLDDADADCQHDEVSGEEGPASVPGDNTSGGHVPTAQAVTDPERPAQATQQNPYSLLFTSLDQALSVNNLMRRDELTRRVRRSDDWQMVQANKAYYIGQYKQALQHPGFRAPPTQRNTLDAYRKKIIKDLEPEEIANYKRWMKSQADIVKCILTAPDEDKEVELRAWQIVEEMITLHQRGIKVTAQTKERSLTCTQRVAHGLKVLKDYPIIRHRILDGERIADFCASPDAYATARTCNLDSNFNRRGGGKDNQSTAGTKSGMAKDGLGAAMKRRLTSEQMQKRVQEAKSASQTPPAVSQAGGAAPADAPFTTASGMGGVGAESAAEVEHATQNPAGDLGTHNLEDDRTAQQNPLMGAAFQDPGHQLTSSGSYQEDSDDYHQSSGSAAAYSHMQTNPSLPSSIDRRPPPMVPATYHTVNIDGINYRVASQQFASAYSMGFGSSTGFQHNSSGTIGQPYPASLQQVGNIYTSSSPVPSGYGYHLSNHGYGRASAQPDGGQLSRPPGPPPQWTLPAQTGVDDGEDVFMEGGSGHSTRHKRRRYE